MMMHTRDLFLSFSLSLSLLPERVARALGTAGKETETDPVVLFLSLSLSPFVRTLSQT